MKNEVLAPCGDIDSFYSAIYNDADAVYLGVSDFNARIKAPNFTAENISEIVKFAHLFGVKVYLTVNILIKNDEVDKFLETIDTAVKAKVDAFIIQDIGMAMLLKQNYKNIVLHASTQMGIHNLKGAKVLEKLGFKRIVLSRETKLEDIKDIRENTNLEIEYFVQGALCVAFSGNCYLSSLKNGNSGNRGRCLQLCRLPYTAIVNDKEINKAYYLSPSDLCLIENLDLLIKAGVSSFKIEGRLKRASYIAQTVKSYRKAIDCLNDGVKFDVKKEIENMRAIFSRGEYNTNAYLNNNKKIINEYQQEHEGVKTGEVIKVEPFKDLYKITIKSSHEIKNGDGLRIVSNKRVSSLGVGNVNKKNDIYEIFSIRKIDDKSEVFLTVNSEKEKELLSYKINLPLDMFFEAKLSSKPILRIKYKDVEVQVAGDDICQMATNQPLNKNGVEKQMAKLLDTPFRLNSLECNLDNVFIPLSSLNQIRRNGIQKIEQAIIEKYDDNAKKIEKISSRNSIEENSEFINKKSTYLLCNNFDQIKNYLGNINYTIIYSPLLFSKKDILDFYEKLNKAEYKNILYINLPIIADKKETEFIDQIISCLDFKFGIVANNYWALDYLGRYPVIAGIGLNIYNKNTVNFYKNIGVDNFIYSIESFPFIENQGIEYVSGNIPLMTLCHCPFRVVFNNDCKNCSCCDMGYKDEKGNLYKIRKYKIINCYFELFSDERIEKNKTDVNQLIDLR